MKAVIVSCNAVRIVAEAASRRIYISERIAARIGFRAEGCRFRSMTVSKREPRRLRRPVLYRNYKEVCNSWAST